MSKEGAERNQSVTGQASIGQESTRRADSRTTTVFSEKGPFPIFDAAEVSKLSNRNLEVATRAARAYFNGASRMNQEVMSFVNGRMKKDIACTQALMTSKTSDQAFHVQADFVEEAIRDYADEASQMLRIAAEMARETFSPMEQRTEEVLRDMENHANPASASASATASERTAETRAAAHAGRGEQKTPQKTKAQGRQTRAAGDSQIHAAGDHTDGGVGATA